MPAEAFAAAEQAFHAGDLERVRRICGRILAATPRHPGATLLRGLAEARMGEAEAAVESLKAALELSPNDYIATTWLQVALRKAGRLEEAVEVGERARRLWPDDVDVLVNLSHAYLGVRDVASGAECLSRAAGLRPNDAAIRRRLGIAYELLGRDEDAATELRRAVELAPRSEEAYARLGRLLMGHGNFTQTIELCEAALGVLPGSAQIRLLYAQALRGVRQNEAAQANLDAAIALDPEIVLSAGLWLHEDGKFDEAATMFRRSIERRPVQGISYFGLVKGKKATESDRELLAKMEALLAEPGLPPKERAALFYGLGKAANDLRDYERAMARFDAGNELNYQIYLSGRGYDRAATERSREQIVRLFSPELMDRHRGLGSRSEVPIFVVGMIRSGTTLVEQILASHRDVAGAGEQRFWVNELPRLIDLEAQTLDAGRFEEARDRYLRLLRSFGGDAPRITDKMPLNFYGAGPIHLAYPEARFVHIRRHPVDTALSIYMTDLAKPPDFAHRKENIVAEYRNYLGLMAHWRKLLPPDRLLEIRYEDLVADPEFWTRRMLDFCGLDWDPSCLRFYENDRPVSTPSMWQVRQPIYRSSLERWRHYEPWLGAFAELLED